jgi:hypothetical protein
MMHKPDENTVLIRRREVAWRPFEGEVILVNTAQDEICHLNPVAAYIWETLDGRLDLRRIAERLAQEFAVGQEEALRDALAFSAELLEQGVVEVVGEPGL